MSFFQNIFKEPEGCPIQEILEVLGLFPRMITDEMNEYLTKEISEEEIRHTLQTFQKGKSPEPDGFTVEFYLGFYDMLKKGYIRSGERISRVRETPREL